MSKDNERYYSLSLLHGLAYDDDVNGNCDGMIDFTVVDSISGADVEPVRHGEWIPHMINTFFGPLQDGWHCSLCGRQELYKQPYCNCGACMNGGNKNG